MKFKVTLLLDIKDPNNDLGQPDTWAWDEILTAYGESHDDVEIEVVDIDCVAVNASAQTVYDDDADEDCDDDIDDREE